MAEELGFTELIARVRAGDSEAATALVTQFEPVVRLEARLRLGRGDHRREVDSEDICQSLFASLLLRLRLGQYEIPSAEDLLRLVLTMARNKSANHRRRRRRQRRDVRRTDFAVDVEALPARPDPRAC